MNMHFDAYLKKLHGCFTGKAVGGTLGMPMEGYIGTKDISYYDPVPTSMLANDDLDLQVVWVEVIRRCGLPVNRRDLADGWLRHMKALPDEYGVVIRNLRTGLFPPLSGYYDNKFYAGMGSAIRTELWAGLAPGDPELAVKLSREDACCDHYADGVEASAFLAAVESAAYTENDRTKLIETGLHFTEPGGRLYKMFTETIKWWVELRDPLGVRERILKKYFVQNWTDVGINLSFILIGWLAGDEETEPSSKISRALCTVAGLGHDGDCTAATLGSILGILYPDAFEKRWTDPLGDDLVLSGCISAMHEKATITEFCGQVASLCIGVQEYYGSPVRLSDRPPTGTESIARWADSDDHISLAPGYDRNESCIALRPFTVKLIYPEKVALAPSESGLFTALISVPGNRPVPFSLKLKASDGWKTEPSDFHIDAAGQETKICFSVTAPVRSRRVALNSLDFHFKTQDLSFTVSAGLIETINFRHVKYDFDVEGCPPDKIFENAEIIPIYNHFWKIPGGAHLYSVEMRPHARISEAIMLIQGTRPVKVWYDGELIMSHDGSEYCPAFHRSENLKIITLSGEWKRFILYAGKGIKDGVPRGKNDTPFNSLAPVEGCPTPYEIRKKYDAESLYGGEDGELFFGLANRTSYEWIYELEWR